ncbi:hypothetical protein PU634_05170 [Oceanimonas pelagia]|uniref:Uncharacterized protein n=1 Tax=Oceanimonas pelagia TaxID=3028314 RepID=A0AA50KQB5_9GAMM|nr:hypothetical protein [Oceanimonas pelagia]WMC11759.1 hypothetical protein PU634_05170 [Oceanimonas pelagia]
MSAQLKVITLMMMLAVSAICGWHGRGWLEDSNRLAAKEAADAAIAAAMARESGIAEMVEQKLAGLQAAETVIDRGIIREIEKPIYRNVCLEPAAVRLLNAAASGDTASDTAKPAGAMP